MTNKKKTRLNFYINLQPGSPVGWVEATKPNTFFKSEKEGLIGNGGLKMKRFLNVVHVCLVISLLVIPAFTLFNAGCLAADVRLKDKHPPSWYQILPAEKRFVLVMNDEAVLDKETGLVWERAPDVYKTNWYSAIDVLVNKIIGGRKGWRLPTYEELASLVDTSQHDPALPSGHPFINVQYANTDYYWSATSNPGTTTINARSVEFKQGYIIYGNKNNSVPGLTWCVRGPGYSDN